MVFLAKTFCFNPYLSCFFASVILTKSGICKASSQQLCISSRLLLSELRSNHEIQNLNNTTSKVKATNWSYALYLLHPLLLLCFVAHESSIHLGTKSIIWQINGFLLFLMRLKSPINYFYFLQNKNKGFSDQGTRIKILNLHGYQQKKMRC
jgi:hypothetical protein